MSGQLSLFDAPQKVERTPEPVPETFVRPRFSAVLGNPPYIVVNDPALRSLYRTMYISAIGKYGLSAPFAERIFRLARSGGFTGQITSNAFMTREFGKPLIEKFFPTVDLTGIVNTSGAYIPGHGTPTVILFGRNRPPAPVRASPEKRDDSAAIDRFMAQMREHYGAATEPSLAQALTG
jgi:hypothetical protein